MMSSYNSRLRGTKPLNKDEYGNIALGTLDNDFDTIMAKISDTNISPDEKKILDKLQYKKLASYNWLETTNDTFLRILNLRQFFGVDSLNELQLTQQVAFRQSNRKDINPYALATWLRKGELESIDLELPMYSHEKFKNAIPQIRQVACELPRDFFIQMVNILHETGVGLIGVINPPNTAVNGTTRKLYGKIIIQMSIHLKRADIFLFSLLHEIAHILLHDIENQAFISLNPNKRTRDSKEDKEELEADNFASEELIKSALFNEFIAKNNFDMPAIKYFAKQTNVHPDIIMGRLEHMKIVPYKRFAKHYTKLYYAT